MGCGPFMSLVLVFFGVLLLLETTGVVDDLFSTYWPVILIILGLSSLYKSYRFRAKLKRFGGRWPPDVGP